jgi:hypothetical protein
MRNLPVLFLSVLLISHASAADPIERIELEHNISLIISSPEPDYFIISLVNKNNFNVSFVENVTKNFSYDIDGSTIAAFDNFNQRLVPVHSDSRSVVLNYNSTLPPLGYGKIFLSVEKLKHASPKPTVGTISPTETPVPTFNPEPDAAIKPTAPPEVQKEPPEAVSIENSTEPSPDNFSKEPNFFLWAAIIILILSALAAAKLKRLRDPG